MRIESNSETTVTGDGTSFAGVPFDLSQIRTWLNSEVQWPEGTSVSGARLGRVWFGRHARLSFELALDLDMKGQIHACTLQGATGSQVTKKRRHLRARVTAHGLLGLRLTNSSLTVGCCSPDRDHRLPTVRKLLDDKQVGQIVRDAIGTAASGFGSPDALVVSKLIAYRMGKRCTLHLKSTDIPSAGGMFAKVFRRSPGVNHGEVLRSLASQLPANSDGRVRIPELLAYLPRQGLMLTDGVTNQARTLDVESDALAGALTGLTALHRCHVPVSRIHQPTDELQTVSRWVHGLRTLGYGEHARLQDLVVALSLLVSAIDDSPDTLIHRDFFSRQILTLDDRVWLTDLDTLCLGHKEQDIATYVAHVLLERALSEALVSDETDLLESFVGGYEQHCGSVCRRRLAFYFSCATARLGAIHLVRGVRPSVIDELWGLAEQYANGGEQPT